MKRKQEGRNLKSELEILKEIQTNKSFDYLLKLYYIHGVNPSDPDYFVLEDFGRNLKFYYGYDVQIRSLFIKEILKAVDAFHQLGYMHGDIKPENILISFTSNGSYKCKLCDFSRSIKIQPGSEFPRSSDGKLYFTKDWVCPEVYQAIKKEEKEEKRGNSIKVSVSASTKIDTFVVALVIDELCRNYIGRNDTNNNLLKLENYLKDRNEISSLSYCVRNNHQYKSIIEEMLSINPYQRKSISHYLNEIEIPPQKEDPFKETVLELLDKLCKQGEVTLSEILSFRQQIQNFETKLTTLNVDDMKGLLNEMRDEIITNHNQTLNENAINTIQRITEVESRLEVHQVQLLFLLELIYESILVRSFLNLSNF